MTLLRRLCLCLLALALLPGATLQARMLQAPVIADAASTKLEHAMPARGCHQALPTQDVDAGNAHARHDHEAAEDCCGDGASSPDCSQHCACPATAPAPPLAVTATAFAMHQPRWSVSVAQGNDRIAHGPPKRPPIR